MKTYGGSWRPAVLGGILFAAGLALAGCGRSSSDAGGAPEEKTYPITGEVLKIESQRNVLIVQHDAVAGLMPAMTMEFSVSPGDVSVLHVGERIRADLLLVPNGMPQLERIWPDDKIGREIVAAGARDLREDTHERGASAYREVGENMPSFALYDQDGRVVRSDRFRGKQVMLNFIFTRCPVATMCPLSTQKMIETQQLARKENVKSIEFVSITLDPTYDTPGVLKAYAQARNIDTGNFSFLTGPESAIRDLLTQFGVIAEFDGGLLKHTLVTLLIDERGRIIWRADGSAWLPHEFVERMRKG